MKRFSFLFLCLLSACAPKAILKPQEVDVPIPVSCPAKMPQEPAWAVSGARNGTLIDKVQAMAIDLTLAHGYIIELQAALNACGQ